MITEHLRKIDDCRIELNNIQQWINANRLHSNVRYLVAYAVVKASGTIEIIFKSMMCDFLSDNVKVETQTYLNKMLVDSSCNPSVGNMLRMLEQIDAERKENFNDKTRGIRQKGDLNSLVSLRNDIAHGRTINATIRTVKQYFESGINILDILDKILYPVTTV